MKKIAALCLVSMLTIGWLSGCTSVAMEQSSKDISQSSMLVLNSSEQPSQNPTSSMEEIIMDPSCSPVIADSALCRGELTEITSDGKWVITPVEGRNYGRDSFTCNIEGTRFETDKEEISVGDYLELYYGASPNGDKEAEISPIQISKLLPANMCITNGKVIESSDSHLLVEIDHNKDNRVYFHISEQTKVYSSALQKDDLVSIYHTGVFTRSLPPQGNALEISIVKE